MLFLDCFQAEGNQKIPHFAYVKCFSRKHFQGFNTHIIGFFNFKWVQKCTAVNEMFSNNITYLLFSRTLFDLNISCATREKSCYFIMEHKYFWSFLVNFFNFHHMMFKVCWMRASVHIENVQILRSETCQRCNYSKNLYIQKVWDGYFPVRENNVYRGNCPKKKFVATSPFIRVQVTLRKTKYMLDVRKSKRSCIWEISIVRKSLTSYVVISFQVDYEKKRNCFLFRI